MTITVQHPTLWQSQFRMHLHDIHSLGTITMTITVQDSSLWQSLLRIHHYICRQLQSWSKPRPSKALAGHSRSVKYKSCSYERLHRPRQVPDCLPNEGVGIFVHINHDGHVAWVTVTYKQKAPNHNAISYLIHTTYTHMLEQRWLKMQRWLFQSIISYSMFFKDRDISYNSLSLR